MKTITVIQARLGSSRLPGKVLLTLGGKPALEQMVLRVKKAKHVGTVVVATTTQVEDQSIVDLCIQKGIEFFKGHPTDCLDRHYQAGLAYGADVVVKIPSDCPIIDPAVIDHVIEAYIKSPDDWDYVSNLHPPTHPDGNDVEVMRFSALEKAWKESTRAIEREHTTVYLWENPDRFRLANVFWETGLDYSKSFRWVLDYPEDYALIQAVWNQLAAFHQDFTLDEIIDLLKARPEIRSLNEKFLGDAWYQRHSAELKNLGRTISKPR